MELGVLRRVARFIRTRQEALRARETTLASREEPSITMPVTHSQSSQQTWTFTLRKFYQGRPAPDGSFHWKQFADPTLTCQLTQHTGTTSNGLAALILSVEWNTSNDNHTGTPGIGSSYSQALGLPPPSQRDASPALATSGVMPLVCQEKSGGIAK